MPRNVIWKRAAPTNVRTNMLKTRLAPTKTFAAEVDKASSGTG